MATPVSVDLPHSLGREEARRRIAARIGDLPRHMPGGIADMQSSWTTPDQLALAVKAMGQEASARVDVEEAVVRVTMVLPGMLGFMSGAIAAAVREKGGQLLLGAPKKD
jgi:hypothetical protein